MRDLPAVLSSRRGTARRFQRGRVTATGTLLSVKLDDTAEAIKLPVLTGTTYAVNDVVMVARDGTSSLVIGKLGTAPAPVAEKPPPPVSPDPTYVKRSKLILPASTGDYRGGAWRPGDYMAQGDWGGYGINLGAAFYGRSLKSLGADLTRSRSATLYYRRQAGGVFGAQTPTVWTLSQSKRPSGSPTRLTSSTATSVAVNRTASWSLPTGMLDELLDGTAGGLGIYVPGSSPYIVMSGRSDYAKAFAISVSYYTAG